MQNRNDRWQYLIVALMVLARVIMGIIEPDAAQAANFGSLTDNGTAAYMGIGIAVPVGPLHIYSTTSTQPETIDLSGAGPLTAQWNNWGPGGSASGTGFLARFSRGTKASPADVQVGDRLGFNVFGGMAGGVFKHTAAIEAVVDSGAVSGTSLPTYMRFLTTPNGATARVERMRVTGDGNVGIGTATPTAKLEVNGAVKVSGSINRQPTNPPLFRWLPVKVLATYTVTGANPYGIAFDGTNMWTANGSGDSVTKITPAGDNTTYTGNGAGPDAIAFDGTNMWTANYSGNSVTKITPSGVAENYTVAASSPYGIAFDGTNMWTANYSGNSVTKILVITQ